MDDLKLAVQTLQDKAIEYTPLFDYYAGNQPLRYAADRLKDIFQDRQTAFTQNWCAVVVNAVIDRLELTQWSVGDDEAASQALNELWRTTGLEADMEATHRAVAVTGEGYVLAWAGDDGVEGYYHDPRICHIWYEAENPRRKRMGAKWWRDDAGAWRLNLYYPDRILHYVGGDSDLADASSFRLESEERNTAGVVPLFHFYRDRHLLLSELDNVIPLQDAINKLLGDMMIAAEFGAFRQRWIVTNADTSKLRNAPNEIWELPAAGPGEQPTTAGEFATTDLQNYLGAIDKLAVSIGIITSTPRHYFYAQGGDPSGEALIAMEAPLIRKVKRFQECLGDSWSDVASFLLALTGMVVDPLDITPLWESATTVQPRTQAEIRQMDVASGIPLVTVLRDEGWTNADLEQMQADKGAEQAAQQAQLAGAMMRAQQVFDQNAGPGVGAADTDGKAAFDGYLVTN